MLSSTLNKLGLCLDKNMRSSVWYCMHLDMRVAHSCCYLSGKVCHEELSKTIDLIWTLFVCFQSIFWVNIIRSYKHINRQFSLNLNRILNIFLDIWQKYSNVPHYLLGYTELLLNLYLRNHTLQQWFDIHNQSELAQ